MATDTRRPTTSALFASVHPRYPELRGRTALVTGSSRGIGRGIAIRLAAEGMRVALSARSAAPLENLRDELRAAGAEAVAITADLRNPAEVDRLVREAASAWGSIDLLVNNAADLRRVPFLEVTDAMFEELAAANFRAPYLLARRAAEIMRSHGRGWIVNVSSVGGLRAHHPGLPYDATKAALDAMTRGMGVELARYSIRVNGVAPGAIETERHRGLPPGALAPFDARIPSGRLGTPLEIAAAVAFLASEEASYIVGQTLYVDGGITTQLSPPDSPI